MAAQGRSQSEFALIVDLWAPNAAPSPVSATAGVRLIVMSLIDWSDAGEMFGLLIDYVSDEAMAAVGDAERAVWLRSLLDDLESVAAGDAAGMRRALREIREWQPREFASDRVMAHLDDCIEELRRIEMDTRP
jgi:hypothetical protein